MNAREVKILITFIFVFILIRSIHFSQFLNFSFDQAWSSTRNLEIWKNKEITLVGPGSSLVANGKQVLQGSINYYFQLVFLLLGRFDPIVSSYLLMLFVAFMMIPLYFGVKLLYNKKAALFILLVYTLVPYFVDFSRFFFGPIYQLSLMPALILLMGLYKRKKKPFLLFSTFVMTGILLQFHYQIVVVALILLAFYLTSSKTKFRDAAIMIVGLVLGFLPMIVFELKNKFYNFTVLMEYLRYAKKPSDFFFVPHRYLTISLLLLVFAIPLYQKWLTNKLVIIFSVLLLVLDLFLYLPTPSHAFGMNNNWNYLMEKKAYQIIKKEGLKNFNVVNLIYDNRSVVIKYHLHLDNYPIDYDDYYHNKYVFVVNHDENIFNNPAYEVKTFTPHKKLKSWKLNDFYNLYLFERTT